MNPGSFTTVRAGLILVAGLCLMLGASTGLAQTPAEACAADSLYLFSPGALDMRQQTHGRPGLVISWEDLPTHTATCYTLTGLDSLEVTVDVDGGFGDKVDRFLAFTIPDSGMVGHHIGRPLLMSWQSQGSSIYGVLAGSINLANNGGVLRWDSVDGTWSQANTGLPMYWLQTNITALAEGTGGFLVGSFTAGQTLTSSPKGLWAYRTGVWSRIGQDTFADNISFTRLAISPTDNDVFAVGTSRNGLFVTRDGGETFTNFRSDLDPEYPTPPTNFEVGVLNWESDTLWVFFPNFGLFKSEDGGVTFSRSTILVDADLANPQNPPLMIQPTVMNDIAVDPSDSDHVLVALNYNGVWESDDGGATWHDLYGDLHVAGPDNDEWGHSARAMAVDSGNSQVIVAGYTQEGIRRTTDGGATWTMVAQDAQPEGIGPSALLRFSIRSDPDNAGLFYVLEDNVTLLRSSDSGANWEQLPNQPFTGKGRKLMVSRDGSGDLLMSTYGGGTYVPGSPLNLSDTYNTSTSQSLRDLDLGLEITFDDGVLDNDQGFNLVCQTFQGWAVWRAPSYDPHNLTLLGMYDRVNPESCIEGYCGDVSYELVPQCYVSKRAACFNFDTPDTVRFFDDEVYNGFSYNYAVSTFDYGNTALTTPLNNTNSMLFSPRFPDDPNSPYEGNGNLSRIQINSDLADPVDGETIYVYPNPLRRGAGIPGQEGQTVVFTNLPPQSRVRVFTPAGDDIINLGPDNLHQGNIYWRTRNRDGEDVSPGVYLYKVECPTREDHWGKLVIIR